VGVVIVAAVIIDGPAEQPTPGLHGDRLGVLLALAAFAVGLLGSSSRPGPPRCRRPPSPSASTWPARCTTCWPTRCRRSPCSWRGARLLAAAEQPDSGRIAAALERAHHLAQARLRDARRAIGTLRDEELPGPQRLTGLAHEFERDSGVSCHLEVAGERRELDSPARLAVYRTAQEALTNVRRHANAERVELRLGYEPLGTRLVVEDFTPNGARAAPDSQGYGLTGMRERAELLDGTLTAAPTGTGFRVELWVPA
jgi:two-component sensor histidine kinase